MAESTSPLPPSNRNTGRDTNQESEMDDRDIFDTPREEIDEGDSVESTIDEQTNGNDTSRSRTSRTNGNDTSRSRTSPTNGNDTSRSRTSPTNGNDTSRSITSPTNGNDTSRSRTSQTNGNDTSRSRTSQTKPRVIDSETEDTSGKDTSHPNNFENEIKDERDNVHAKKETARNKYSKEEILDGNNTTLSNQNNKKEEIVKSEEYDDENENDTSRSESFANVKKLEKEKESISNDENIKNDSKQPTFSENQKANSNSLKSPSRGSIKIKNVTSSACEKNSDSDRYTDSETTGGKSSLSEHTPRSQAKKSEKKPKRSSKSPKPTKSKSILKTEESKPHRHLAFMASLVDDGTSPRHPTRGSGESTVVSLPALNRQNVINKVYVDDTDKIVNKYPKRDKDFKLEFVYDLRPKYPSWYEPEKRLSRREEKVFSDISGVYADYKQQDERHMSKTKTMDDRLKKLEKLKKEELKARRKKKLAAAYEQYEQLKEVREKFDIMCWYRNQTQYITPRVLEHEKLSRHLYGLPESLKEQEKLIKNLKRKTKKRQKNGNRINSH